MNRELLDLLYRSFDADLTEEERQRLDEALATSEALQTEKERITSIREVLSKNATDSFKPLFTERVMRALETAEETDVSTDVFFESLYRFFRPVALAAAAAAILLVSMNLWDSDDITLAAALGMQEDSIEVMFETPLEAILEEPL